MYTIFLLIYYVIINDIFPLSFIMKAKKRSQKVNIKCKRFVFGNSLPIFQLIMDGYQSNEDYLLKAHDVCNCWPLHYKIYAVLLIDINIYMFKHLNITCSCIGFMIIISFDDYKHWYLYEKDFELFIMWSFWHFSKISDYEEPFFWLCNESRIKKMILQSNFLECI